MMPLKYLLKLFVAILFLILSICSYLPSVHAQDNPNTITFDNQSGEPATVKLVGLTGQTVDVPQGESRTVKVAAGEYYLLVRYGSKSGQYSYTKGDTFEVQQTETQYSKITITLHKVIGGNYPAHPTSREEFDRTTPGSLGSRTISQTSFAVAKAYNIGRLVYRTFVAKGTLEPKSGHTFVAVDLALTSEGDITLNPSDLVLADSLGDRYFPIGIAVSTNLERFQPLAKLRETPWHGTVGFQVLQDGTANVWLGSAEATESERGLPGDGGKVIYARDTEDRPIQLTLSGRGAKFTFVFEVRGSRSGFTLTISKSKPFPIEVIAVLRQ